MNLEKHLLAVAKLKEIEFIAARLKTVNYSKDTNSVEALNIKLNDRQKELVYNVLKNDLEAQMKKLEHEFKLI